MQTATNHKKERMKNMTGNIGGLLLISAIIFAALLLLALYGDAMYGDWRCGMPGVNCIKAEVRQ